MSEKFTEQWWKDLIGPHLEPAENFSPTALVASEMVVRATVVKAIMDDRMCKDKK